MPDLGEALGPDEVARWRGTVETMPHRRRALMVTDRRVVLEDEDQPGGWAGLDILELAERGVLLPRSTLLTMVAATPDGVMRLTLRAIDPPTFDGIEWPRAAQPLIDDQVAASDAARDNLRRTLRRLVVGTIAGMTLLLVVLTLALLVD